MFFYHIHLPGGDDTNGRQLCPGVIAGAGTNHSAEAVSITHPHAGHQAYLGRLVLGRAGIDPLQVGFVESK